MINKSNNNNYLNLKWLVKEAKGLISINRIYLMLKKGRYYPHRKILNQINSIPLNILEID